MNEEPITTDTQFMVGSVTKTVTAAQVLRLAEDGLVDLDAPIAQYLPPDVTIDTNDAPVRQVLHMESGIREYQWTDADDLAASADPTSHWDPLPFLATVPAPRYPPGTRTEYSDTNYVLLGYVIETATGMPVAEALRAGVLSDPRLTRMVFQDSERPQGPLALGHTEDEAR